MAEDFSLIVDPYPWRRHKKNDGYDDDDDDDDDYIACLEILNFIILVQPQLDKNHSTIIRSVL